MLALVVALTSCLFFAPPLGADVTQPITSYADVTLRWDKGVVTVLRVSRGQLPQATALRRWKGRFEARATAGKKTLDFVRFDFPLLANAESPEETTPDATAFARKLRNGITATAVVRLPLPEGATAASIFDSDSGRSVAVSLAPATASTASTPAASASGPARPAPPAGDGDTKR